MPSAVFALASMLASTSVGAEDPEQSANAGRELYVTYQCWQCHGYEGQGGAAARLVQKEYPFELFARFVRFPDVMPAYAPDELSDAELRLVYDYIRSIPEPPALEDIPALRDSR